MILIFECDNKPIKNWKIGKFKSTLKNKYKFHRYWWRWFAVTYFTGDLKEYGDAIRDSVWITV